MIEVMEQVRDVPAAGETGRPEASAPPASGHSPEMLFPEAKRRARRRHAFIGGGIAVLAAVVIAVVALVISVATAVPRQRVSDIGEVLGVHVPSQAAPAYYVRHETFASAEANQIQVVSVASGRVIRTLRAEDSVANGFELSPDRKTLYYSRLDESSQTMKLVATPVAGGRETVIADGVAPLVSPDGTKLVYRPGLNSTTVNVLDLHDGTIVTSTIPRNWGGEDWRKIRVQVAWQSDSQSLYAMTNEDSSGISLDCAYGIRCVYPTNDLARDAAYTLTLARGAEWALVPSPERPAHSIESITLFGAGPQPGTVLGWHWSMDVERDRGVSVLDYVDIATGTIVSRIPAPADAWVGARDASGANFLLRNDAGITSWGPATGATKFVGPSTGEVAW